MRSLFFITMLVSIALLATPAAAINEKNQALLKEHFRSQGEVLYELYAPFGGPELGGAVIRTGGSATLSVAAVREKGECTTLYTQSVNPDFKSPPFTFLLTGQHLFVYSTTPWTDSQGIEHQKGDLRIVSMLVENPGTVLYELKDACDLRIEPGGALTADNLLWQPSPHFLNRFGFLPHKSNYFRLTLDMNDGKYKLHQHLTALPDASTVDYANLNNRALMNYASYRLKDASYLLEQANRLAESDQSIITRNQQYIKSELTDLDQQQNLVPDMPYNEALESFWEGDYSAVLRALEARQQKGYTAFDYAIYGIASAQLKSWPKTDELTIALERMQFPYMGDYLWELVKIALYQDYPEIAMTYLVALQVTDPTHPGYVTGMAKIERMQGNLAEAEKLLENYVYDPANNGRDIADARLELYDLYYQNGNQDGCKRLIETSQQPPLVNLQSYVQLADFIDFATALAVLPTVEGDRLQAPDEPLDGITYQQGVSIK
jgi:hypothetical protein